MSASVLPVLDRGRAPKGEEVRAVVRESWAEGDTLDAADREMVEAARRDWRREPDCYLAWRRREVTTQDGHALVRGEIVSVGPAEVAARVATPLSLDEQVSMLGLDGIRSDPRAIKLRALKGDPLALFCLDLLRRVEALEQGCSFAPDTRYREVAMSALSIPADRDPRSLAPSSARRGRGHKGPEVGTPDNPATPERLV